MLSIEPQLEQIVIGIPGAEGPVLDRLGRLFMVCPRMGQILRIENRTASVHAQTGGNPAGLAIDRENHLWVADMKLGILRVTPDGQMQPILTEFDNAPLRGCNDLCFDARGNLYFTAPAGSSAENPIGEVFFRSTDGEVGQIDRNYAFSNGIAVDAAGKALIVAETMTRKLWRYSLDAPGVTRDRTHFATMPGEHPLGADGLDFDARGFLLAANWGEQSIDAFDADGILRERLMLPFRPSNLHFGGIDRRDLYITEHTTNGLWKTTWPAGGQAEWGLS